MVEVSIEWPRPGELLQTFTKVPGPLVAVLNLLLKSERPVSSRFQLPANAFELRIKPHQGCDPFLQLFFELCRPCSPLLQLLLNLLAPRRPFPHLRSE